MKTVLADLSKHRFRFLLSYLLTFFHTDRKFLPVCKLIKELPVSSSVLHKWTKGKIQPTTVSLIRPAKFFDCFVDYPIGRVRGSSKSKEKVFFSKIGGNKTTNDKIFGRSPISRTPILFR